MAAEKKKFLSDRFGNEIATELLRDGEPDDLLTDKYLAPKCRLSIQWFQQRRIRGDGPPYLRLSPKAIRYVRAAVAEWFAARTATCTSQYPTTPGPGRPAKKSMKGRSSR